MATLCCCCFPIRDQDDDDSTRQNCFVHTLLAKYAKIFSNEQLDVPTSMAQTAALNNIHSDNTTTSTSPPRTLRFDADAATCSGQRQSDGENIRDKEKINQVVLDMKHSSKGNEGRSTACCSNSELKLSFEKSEAGVADHACELLSEDEDVCPTCLEEYISENPRIVLQCSHSYHLSCIYEWMERSENCPICGKVMIFHEAA